MRNKLKKAMAYFISALMIITLLPAHPALAAAEPGISLGSATLTGGNYCYTNAAVSGTGIQTILVNFSDAVHPGDSITLPATVPGDGFTVSASSAGNGYSKRINIDTAVTGTDNAAAVQDYVRGIGIAVASATQTVSIMITSQNIEYDTFYNIDTQHYYQFIAAGSSGIDWTAAYDAAKSMTYMGRSGYLATVMSMEEDTLLNALSGGKTGWLGGTILTNSGSRANAAGAPAADGLYYASFTTTSVVSGSSDGWYWACGPEIGTIFYNTNSLNNEGGANSTVAATVDAGNASTYYNWSRGDSYEPNNQTATQSYDGNDYETCLTTLINEGHTGKHGTPFTWNDCRYFFTDQSSDWSAKGYFVEYGDKTTGDNKTGTAVAGYASAKGTLRNPSGASAITINTYTDEVPTDVSGGVELRPEGSSVPAADAAGVGCYTVDAGSVTSGTAYEVYVNGEDTGKSVTYSGSPVSVDVDYYTVTYSVSDGGAASGSSTSATAGGAAITSGTAVLSGKAVVVTATGAGADSYNYLWSGGGTSGESTGSLYISSMSGAVNAVCAVTGLTSIDLSAAAWQSATTYTCGLALSPSSKMVTIAVNRGYFTIPSLGSGVLTYLGGTNGSSYISAYDASTQYDSAVFSYSDAAAAETLLSAVLYTSAAADLSQTITATSSTVAPVGSDLYFGGHFYRYVSGSINWIDSVVAAGGTADPYFGGRGYIATTTNQAENSILLKLTDTGGSDSDHWNDAWMGGLWQRNEGTVASPSIVRGTSGSEISYSDLSGATPSQRQNLLPDYTMTFNDFDGGNSSTYINALTDTVKYYWIDGPEAGQEIAYNDTAFSPWHSGEPNCGDFAYIGWEGAFWDDLSAYPGDNTAGGFSALSGYIVEFSGFDGGTSAGKIASDTQTVFASYAVSLNTNGGTINSGNITSYSYATGAVLPTDVTKSGYTFAGWYADADFSGSAVTAISAADTGSKMFYAKWTAVSSSGGSVSPAKTIAVTETSSPLFAGGTGAILAAANVNNAFSSSVEVKVTDTNQESASFGFGAGTEVYPFDISLYIKGTNNKTQPASGYAVTISLPIPKNLLDVREKLRIVHKSDSGAVTALTSSLKQVNGIWYLVFDATEFSPYALVVSTAGTYDTASGLPYYWKGDVKVFIGFAANGKYLAPEGVTVLFTPNPKAFTDISAHWGKPYIDFVTEREIFKGTAADVFSPDAGMTRAMLATVIGRLYERSFGEITISDARAFADCNYSDYYGKYVDWAAANGIIQGMGGGKFQPNRQVSRQEMAAMLYRFAECLKLSGGASSGTTLNYPDAADIDIWAKDAALYCQQTGIMTGRSGNRFSPKETASRAEVAAIIQRFVEQTLK